MSVISSQLYEFFFFQKINWNEKSGRTSKSEDHICIAHVPLDSNAEERKHMLSVAHTCQEEKRKGI